MVNAIVTDKQGNPVVDLTADDFKVYEDGKPQPIHTFGLESFKAAASRDARGLKPSPEGSETEAPHYSQPRLISIVIDDITSPPDDHYASMTEALMRFIERDMGPGDKVALVAASGHNQYPFTNDKRLLLEQIHAFSRKLNVSRVSKSTCPTLTDLQALRIANEPMGVGGPEELELAIRETIDCLNLHGTPDPERIADSHTRSVARVQWSDAEYRSRTLIQTLRQHIRSLKHFEAFKSIVLFSNGFVSQELVYELQDVVDQALRSGIVVNTVDLRGLYTAVPQASERAHVAAAWTRVKQSLLSEDLTSREGPLNQLAHDTGGVFYHNSNDLYAGLQEISNRQAQYYVLTYASPSQKADGRYHKIKLEVSQPGLELSYRNGYYAPKEELTYERRRKEDILEVLRAPGDVNEIPIDLAYNYYQVEESRYEIAVVTQIDIRRVQFAEEESRRRNQITLVVVVLDEADNAVDGSVKTVEFNLTPAGYSELLSQGFASRVNFHLPAGKYRIKAVVREGMKSKVGSVTTSIAVP